jgi:hypothetical protein
LKSARFGTWPIQNRSGETRESISLMACGWNLKLPSLTHARSLSPAPHAGAVPRGGEYVATMSSRPSLFRSTMATPFMPS